jgi:hypothetical protein
MGSFHPECVSDAKAEEEEENGTEDGLESGKHFEPIERSINCQIEIPAEAEDIQRIRGAEAQGFPKSARVETPGGTCPMATTIPAPKSPPAAAAACRAGSRKGRAREKCWSKKGRGFRGLSARRLTEARAILRSSRELAEAVFAGLKLFDAALAEVEATKKQNESDETKLARLLFHN